MAEPADLGKVKMAALRMTVDKTKANPMRSEGASSSSMDEGRAQKELWNDDFFFRRPGGSKDQWVCTKLSQGW